MIDLGLSTSLFEFVLGVRAITKTLCGNCNGGNTRRNDIEIKMFRRKQDVDRHVSAILGKIKEEREVMYLNFGSQFPILKRKDLTTNSPRFLIL